MQEDSKSRKGRKGEDLIPSVLSKGGANWGDRWKRAEKAIPDLQKRRLQKKNSKGRVNWKSVWGDEGR